MPPLNLLGSPPITLVGEVDHLNGEAWLSNPTSADITISQATLTVAFAPPETGPIGLPPDAVVAQGSTRRLVITMSMQPLTPPQTYAAHIDLVTSAGNQSFPAQVIITANLSPVLVPQSQVFTGVTSGAVLNGSVVVVNQGNVPIPVTQIGDEDVLDMATIPRVFAFAAGGAVLVQPASGLVPVGGGKATFTNNQPTIAPGSSTKIDFQLTAPAGLPANAQLRVLPRIANQRFAVDLLT